MDLAALELELQELRREKAEVCR